MALDKPHATMYLVENVLRNVKIDLDPNKLVFLTPPELACTPVCAWRSWDHACPFPSFSYILNKPWLHVAACTTNK